MPYTTIPELSDAVDDITTELGTDPSGVYSNTRARLDILEARINNPNAPSPTVENPFIVGTSGITIAAGSGAPSSSAVNGSLFLRSDGAPTEGVYTRRSGVWIPVAATAGSFTASNDLDGDNITQTVVGLQNEPLPPPSGTNTILTWDGTVLDWSPIPSSFTAGGDLSGSSTSQTVIRINGATVPVAGTTGNSLQVTGVNTLGYAAINLAGGVNFVTGTLPNTNQQDQAVGNNLSGTTGNAVTTKLNNASVPAAGSLVTGNILQVSGTSTLSYAALNLAGGTNFVTGVLPNTNQQAQTVGGNLSGTTASATVISINSATVPAAGSLTTGNLLQVTGSSALGYGPLNLAGGSNFVTGTLPSGNQAAQTLSGNVTGTTASNTVVSINSATVPSAGSLTTGNVLQVTGSSALGYAPLNLAGGVNFITGTLPTANQANQTVGNNLSGTTNSAVVIKINGTSVDASPSANQLLVATSSTTSIWSAIFDGYVASNAAIAGTKISPNFGSQNISTTGTLIAGASAGSNVITGANRFTTRTITGNLTVDTTTTDMIILCNFSTGSTITLGRPDNGRMIIIKDIGINFGTNNLTISPNTSELIDGISASKVFATDGGTITLVANGTNWFCL